MSAISGQKAVASAGTAVVLGSQEINGPLLVKALAGNSGNIFIGNDGTPDVAAATGLELAAKAEVYFKWVGSLNSLWIDTDNSGDGVAWLALDV